MIEAILTQGSPDAKKRNCYDCAFCKGAMSWWCKNPRAVEHRGTSIPGTQNCRYWQGVRTKQQLRWYERFFGNFIYIDPQ